MIVYLQPVFIAVNKTLSDVDDSHSAGDGESVSKILQSMSDASCDTILLIHNSNSYFFAVSA